MEKILEQIAEDAKELHARYEVKVNGDFLALMTSSEELVRSTVSFLYREMHEEVLFTFGDAENDVYLSEYQKGKDQRLMVVVVKK
jgi:hypothetical protein